MVVVVVVVVVVTNLIVLYDDLNGLFSSVFNVVTFWIVLFQFNELS